MITLFHSAYLITITRNIYDADEAIDNDEGGIMIMIVRVMKMMMKMTQEMTQEIQFQGRKQDISVSADIPLP